MGVVYKAEDTKLKRTVALKFLPRGLEAQEPERARFLQEAQAAAALNHPNICTIYDIAQEGNEQCIVMECVDGVTLREKVAARNLQMADCIGYAIQIGDALQEAHGKGIVHRDIKAENIMVNEKKQVKVMDFGLAKLKGSLKLTKTSSTVGTLAYMAPEQIEGGEVDARSDIFSFGVLLFEMLTGHLPFRGEHEAAMVYSIVNEEPESLLKHLPDAPMELLHVLNRALEKDPEDRYQFVHEMVIDLRRLKKETTRVVRHTAPVEPSEGLYEKLRKPSEDILRTKWFRPSAMSVGSLLVLVLLYLFAWPPVRDLLFATKRIPIAVISFENQTGDPQFDYLRTAIPNLLITSLEQSSSLRVTTWERMRDLLKQMGKPADQVVNSDLGFELCRRDSVRALVTGSFVKMGEMFATDVKVLDVESKALLKSAGSKGEGVGSILKVQIDELGKQIATGIGLAEMKVAAEQKTMADVTTSSLQAYNLYLRGTEDYDKMYYIDARTVLEKAIALDTMFAMAHFRLARTYSALSERQLSRNALAHAFRLRDKVTRKEALFIEAQYAASIELNSGKAAALFKQIVAEFPKEKEGYFRLAFFAGEDPIARCKQALALDPSYGAALNQLGYSYVGRGEYQLALEAFERYAAVNPGDANPYDSMGEMYYFLGKLDDAIAKYKEAIEIKPDFGSTFGIAYVTALKEDYDGAISWVNKLSGPRQSGASRNAFEVPFYRGAYEHWTGRTKEWRQSVSQALEGARKANNVWWVGMSVWVMAFDAAESGLFDQGRKMYDEANRMTNEVYPSYSNYYNAFFGLLKARINLKEGKTKLAEVALDSASAKLPQLDGLYKTFLGFLLFQVHGEILLAQGKTEEAIAHLTKPVDMPTNTISSGMIFIITTFYPRNLLAKAYIQRGDLDDAIKEYERITTFDPASRDRRMINPRDRYELAALYEKKGMKEKAIAQYEKVLAIWNHADKGHAESKEAKARLAKLRGGK